VRKTISFALFSLLFAQANAQITPDKHTAKFDDGTKIQIEHLENKAQDPVKWQLSYGYLIGYINNIGTPGNHELNGNYQINNKLQVSGTFDYITYQSENTKFSNKIRGVLGIHYSLSANLKSRKTTLAVKQKSQKRYLIKNWNIQSNHIWELYLGAEQFNLPLKLQISDLTKLNLSPVESSVQRVQINTLKMTNLELGISWRLLERDRYKIDKTENEQYLDSRITLKSILAVNRQFESYLFYSNKTVLSEVNYYSDLTKNYGIAIQWDAATVNTLLGPKLLLLYHVGASYYPFMQDQQLYRVYAGVSIGLRGK
tara:strand:+ start:1296 stop:2234 length:939 start_codon:yes stop_codon:yes gene_type:complete